MSELRGLGEVNDELKRQGGRLLAISTDPPVRTKKVVEKNRLEYPVLCDVDKTVIQAYGIVHEGAGPGGADIALPANILIDKNAEVVWTHIASNIVDRLSPDEVLAQAKEFGSALE